VIDVYFSSLLVEDPETGEKCIGLTDIEIRVMVMMFGVGV
jgi:hypothetical protein